MRSFLGVWTVCFESIAEALETRGTKQHQATMQTRNERPTNCQQIYQQTLNWHSFWRSLSMVFSHANFANAEKFPEATLYPFRLYATGGEARPSGRRSGLDRSVRDRYLFPIPYIKMEKNGSYS